MNYTIPADFLSVNTINVTDCVLMSESYNAVLTYEIWVAFGVSLFAIYFIILLIQEIYKKDD